jgi:hypothetical protein
VTYGDQGLTKEAAQADEAILLLYAGHAESHTRHVPASSEVPDFTDPQVVARELVRFMHEEQRIPLAAMTECDLRVFVHGRCARVDPRRYRFGALPTDTLPPFFDFLRVHGGLGFPWANAVLGDAELFMARLRTFPRHWNNPKEEREWDHFLDTILQLGALRPDQGELGGIQWLREPGPRERMLRRWLERAWLARRDALIRSGIVAFATVSTELMAMQREWESTVHPGIGVAPVDAIALERGDEIRLRSGPVAEPALVRRLASGAGIGGRRDVTRTEATENGP